MVVYIPKEDVAKSKINIQHANVVFHYWKAWLKFLIRQLSIVESKIEFVCPT